MIGWIIFSFGVLQIPGWAIYAIYKQKGDTLLEVCVRHQQHYVVFICVLKSVNLFSFLKRIRNAAKPTHNWGPLDAELNKKYQKELPIVDAELSIWGKIKRNVTGAL